MLLAGSISASQLSISVSPLTAPEPASVGLLQPPPAILAAAKPQSLIVKAPVLPAFSKPSAEITFSVDPTDSEISTARCFDAPLEPSSSERIHGENAALAQALLKFHKEPANLDPINGFLTKFPKSRWRASLDLDVALICRHEARWTKILPLLEESWNLSKDETSGGIRATADRTFGELTQMHARLGHYERLQSLFEGAKGRDVRGAGTEAMREAREGLWSMQHEPGEAFRCGPLALARIYGYQFPSQQLPKELDEFKSTTLGTSLYEVNAWAKKIKLNYQVAYRNPGADILVPSVIHWKVGHFAALMPSSQGTYISRDATFRSDDALSKDVIDAEASGYFLVPTGALPGGWRKVPDEEAKNVFGKGDVGEAGCPPDPDDFCPVGEGGSSSSCASCSTGDGDSSDDEGGMTTYAFEPASVSLILKDTPVGYSPPVGRPIRFTVNYNHREMADQSNVSNLGNKWSFEWLSYIQVNSKAATVRYGPGGGQVTFTGYNSSNGYFAPQLLNQDQLVEQSNTNYILYHKDGSREIYNLSEASESPRIYRTSSIDKIGNTTKYIYDIYYRMVGIQDPIGQITVISYTPTSIPGNANFYEITNVTDPFGRSATFAYNASGQLASITDVLGIISSFTYGTGDFVTSLTTPYGTTRFSSFDTTLNNGGNLGGLFRSLQVTDPLGGQERIEWDEILSAPFQDVTNTPGVGGFGTAPSLAPPNFTNSYLVYRNTFYWNKEAMMSGPGNYNDAYIFHWLHDLASGNTRNGFVLESTKAPLENRVWHAYNGQAATIYEGTSNQPVLTSRVLDDGTVQTHMSQFNQNGNITQSIDPMGRTVDYSYDGNGIDVQQIAVHNGSSLEINETISNNAYHLPASVTDAAGQTTTFTYNSFGEVLTVTDPLNEVTTYSYDSSGYLQSITGPAPGAVTSFTYDLAGRIQSITDPEGYTLSFTYDAADRLLTVAYPDGTFTQNIYNLLDLQWTKDRIGRWTLKVHDALRHVVAVQDPLLHTTYFEHCVCGALIGLVDSNGKRTTFNRDLQQRLVQKILADGSTISMVYEKTTSRLHLITDQSGQTKSYTYNKDDSLQTVAYINPLTPTANITYAYDNAYPRRISMVDGIGTTTYSYIPVSGTPNLGAGRLASVSGPLPNSGITYSYDQLGRVLSESINGSVNRSNWIYDALGRTTTVTNPLGQFDYHYVDETSRIQSVDYPNGQISKFSYYPIVVSDGTGNEDQRIETIQNLGAGGANLSTFTLSYDKYGKIVTLAKQLDSGPINTGILDYDATDQLTSALVVNPATEVTQGFFYSYDPAGNRTQEQIDSSIDTASFNSTNEYATENTGGLMSFEGFVSEPATVTIAGIPAKVNDSNQWLGTAPVSAGNQLIPIIATDAAGDSVSKNINVNVTGGPNRTLTYDSNGNVTNNGAGQSYQWDAENRLVAIIQVSGTTNFVYDGVGRRSQEKLNGVIIKQWVWCGSHPCEELDGNGNLSKMFFAQGEQIGGTNYYFTRDHLGSIRECSDVNGAIRARYDYDPYGRVTKMSGDTDADYGFTGDYFHKASGLTLTYFRAYDPNLGRWLSRDPIAANEGTDPYEYVGNDPVNAVDPNGGDTLTLYVSYAPSVSSRQDRAGSHVALQFLEKELAACQKYGIYISLQLYFENEPGGEGIHDYPEKNHVVIGNVTPGAWGETTTGSRVRPDAPKEVIAHELGHQGGYSVPAAISGFKKNEDGSYGEDTSHNMDPNNLMNTYSPNGGQVDCTWCNAVDKLTH
jgi:RHS repeat-associated protein